VLAAHNLNSLSPFIRGYYIDPEICDRIVAESNLRKANFMQGQLINDTVEFTGSRLDDYTPKVRDPYVEALFEVIEEYKKEFKFSYEIIDTWGLPPGMKVQYYTPGQAFRIWHCESSGDPVSTSRHLVYMTYLNTIEDEGGTEFYHQQLKVKPEKGLTLIWPVDWTHTHRGVPSTTEEKYIITGWWTFQR